jgi:hypothetical protein
MKIRGFTPATAFLAGLLSCAVKAAEQPKASLTPTLILHAHVLSVPKARAAEFISSPEMKTDPAAVLKRIKAMVAEKKAFYIANPSLNAAVGTRAVSDSLATLEAEAKLSSDDPTSGSVTLALIYARQRITTSSPFRVGGTLFLGSVDPGTIAPPEREPSTHLIFLHVQ